MRLIELAALALLLSQISACDREQDVATLAGGPVVEIIATGANIAGANGIHFGPDGLLYVASVVGSEIMVIDPESGEEINRYTRVDGVIGPDDLAFARDGAFYWTSILTGEVAGFTADDDEKIVAAQLAPGVNPITFSDDDRLFVAQCFLGTNLYELDPAGEREPRLISDTLGPGCGLNGMDWGPDGRLYGPRWFAGEVVSFDVDDNSMRVEASGFQTPAAVKFNSRGELHVLDTARGEVIKVDAGEKQTVATVGIGLDNFAFDARDRLFVSSFTDGYVRRVDADGSVTELQPGGLCHAGGAAIMGNNVVLADLHGIRGYDLESGELAFTQRNIVGVSEIGGAFNVALDGDNLILVSWFDGDVRIWDPVNEKRVARYPDLVLPVAAVRYGDAIAVAEHGKSRVVAFSNEGAETTLASGLPAPTGLVVEGGNLYVSDRTLGQILLIASGGKALPEPRVIVANLTTPEGFVVTENGFVIVEADLGHVTAVDSAGQRQVLAEIPPGTQAFAEAYPPSQIFNGIAVAPDGRLYVPGETDRSLYRISY